MSEEKPDNLPEWVYTVKSYAERAKGWAKTFWAFLKAIGSAVWAVAMINPVFSLVTVAVVIVLMFLFCGRGDSNLEKEADKQGDIAVEKRSEANVQEAETEKAKANVQPAKKDAQNASKEREKANKKDSAEYNGQEAEDKYCQRWPSDSSCADWRKRNGLD